MGKLQQIAAEALGGASINGKLARCRANAESELVKNKAELQQLCDAAKAKRVAIDDVDESPLAIVNAKTDAVLASGRVLLQGKKEALTQAVRTKEAFRMLHGILRDPEEPSILLNVVVFGTMIFGEAFINAAFFQNAHLTATPSAALLISVLISATNILASCCGGFFIGRWLNYGINAVEHDAAEFRNMRHRARIFQIIIIGVIGFLHLSVGLVRSQETLTKIDHSLSAYGDLLHTPEAVLLVIMGICLSLIAWHKGKSTFSDPYPNYSAHQKAVIDASEAILDLQEDLHEQLEDVFENGIEQSAKTTRKHQKSIQKFNEAVEECMAAHRELVSSISLAESELTANTALILDSYRASGGELGTSVKPDVSFQKLLAVDLPELLPTSEQSSQSANLNAAKAAALERLGALFTDFLTPDNGEDS